jgi:uncharacterized membrane protein
MAETYTETYETQGQTGRNWRNNLSNLRGNVNVGKKERWAMVLGGAALAALALRRRSKGSLGLAALGAPLLWRGATGHCPVYQKMGIDTANGLGTSSFSSSSTQGQPMTLAPNDENRGITATEIG